ncbi:unnamed protein product [Diplocarpon coronariae]
MASSGQVKSRGGVGGFIIAPAKDRRGPRSRQDFKISRTRPHDFPRQPYWSDVCYHMTLQPVVITLVASHPTTSAPRTLKLQCHESILVGCLVRNWAVARMGSMRVLMLEEEIAGSRAELEWLGDIRVLGFNPGSPGVSKCFVTGPATAKGYVTMVCEFGDDPNVTPDKFGTGGPNKTHLTACVFLSLAASFSSTLSSYSCHDPDAPLAIPFHYSRLELFAKAVEFRRSGKFGGMIGGRLWMRKCCLGEKPFHKPSATETQLNSNFDILRLASNPISKLAKEVTCELLLYLPYKILQQFAFSGFIPFGLSSMPSFWHRKQILDMSLLWDLPSLDGPQDWFQLYQKLRRHCFAMTPRTIENEEDGGVEGMRVVEARDQSPVLGSANRRRVWETCEQFAEFCAERLPKDREDSGRAVAKEILEGSRGLGTSIVGSPVETGAEHISVYLLSGWEDLERDMDVRFHFEKGAGRLCGIERLGERTFGKRGDGQGVLVKRGTWITGLELHIGGADDPRKGARVGVAGIRLLFQDGSDHQVGARDGDKRLLAASEGTLMTGLIGELADSYLSLCLPHTPRTRTDALKSGYIQRLGLLQCSSDRKPQADAEPFSPTDGIIAMATSPSAVPTLQRDLRRSSIPPAHTHAADYLTGYPHHPSPLHPTLQSILAALLVNRVPSWTPARNYDTIPMRAIIFGDTPSALSQIIGFSSDAQLRSFAIHFADGTERRIGPDDTNEWGRKVSSINGGGGGDVLSARSEEGEGSAEIGGVSDGASFNPPGFAGAGPLRAPWEDVATAGEEDYVRLVGRWW